VRIGPFRAVSAQQNDQQFFSHKIASAMPNQRRVETTSEAYRREVGARLRLVRRALGLPAGRLAAELGVAAPRWSQWEHGRHLADLRAMVRLAQRYRVTLDYLFLGDESALPRRLIDAMREIRN
jgi:ribosome-binding protein aMBF1 (putative translation factor)